MNIVRHEDHGRRVHPPVGPVDETEGTTRWVERYGGRRAGDRLWVRAGEVGRGGSDLPVGHDETFVAGAGRVLVVLPCPVGPADAGLVRGGGEAPDDGPAR